MGCGCCLLGCPLGCLLGCLLGGLGAVLQALEKLA
jgi:hypothetical protein